MGDGRVEGEVKAVRAQLARRASDKSHSFKRAVDKDLANRLLDALEGVHTENVALQWIIEYFRKNLPPQYQIDQMLARAKGDPLLAGVSMHNSRQYVLAFLKTRIWNKCFEKFYELFAEAGHNLVQQFSDVPK